MTAFLYREIEKLFYLVFISLSTRHTRGKIYLEYNWSVSLVGCRRFMFPNGKQTTSGSLALARRPLCCWSKETTLQNHQEQCLPHQLWMFVQQSFITGTQKQTGTRSCLVPGGVEGARCGTVLLWAAKEVWGVRVQWAAGAGEEGVLEQTGCPPTPKATHRWWKPSC